MSFVDESYWGLVGDPKNINLIATGVEEGPIVVPQDADKDSSAAAFAGPSGASPAKSVIADMKTMQERRSWSRIVFASRFEVSQQLV